jgi:transposase-like protein
MVRPGRDRLDGEVEVDETFVGGFRKGRRGRDNERKALVVIAAQRDGRKIGRIRMARILDASAENLGGFIKQALAPGTGVHTDGWRGYNGLKELGYQRHITIQQGHPPSTAVEALPRVHLVASQLKRWLLGTHQGAVHLSHLDYYLDEFTFRFNRRNSRSRGKLFHRLLEHAVALQPVQSKDLRGGGRIPPPVGFT